MAVLIEDYTNTNFAGVPRKVKAEDETEHAADYGPRIPRDSRSKLGLVNVFFWAAAQGCLVPFLPRTCNTCIRQGPPIWNDLEVEPLCFLTVVCSIEPSSAEMQDSLNSTFGGLGYDNVPSVSIYPDVRSPMWDGHKHGRWGLRHAWQSRLLWAEPPIRRSVCSPGRSKEYGGKIAGVSG